MLIFVLIWLVVAANEVRYDGVMKTGRIPEADLARAEADSLPPRLGGYNSGEASFVFVNLNTQFMANKGRRELVRWTNEII